jgi:hypothetical protein
LAELFHLLFLLNLNENKNGLSLQRLGTMMSNVLMGPMLGEPSVEGEDSMRRRAITICVMIREHEFFYPSDFLARFVSVHRPLFQRESVCVCLCLYMCVFVCMCVCVCVGGWVGV